MLSLGTKADNGELCKNSGLKVEVKHISHMGNMLDFGSDALRVIENIMINFNID